MNNIFSDTNRKTITQIKTELIDSNIDFSDIVREKGNKEKYVQRYVDSLDIIRATQRPTQEKAEKAEEKQLEKAEENAIVKAESILETMTQSLINDAENSLEKDEIILSLVILGHGCEELTSPWPAESSISKYFRNNVRVYSRACVPDTVTLGNLASNPEIIQNINHRFSSIPRNETSSIVRDYAEDSRSEYQKDILYNLAQHKKQSLGSRFEKFSIFENIERASNLSAYLANKNFGFYEHSSTEKVKFNVGYKTLGIHIADIRVKKTNKHGEVSYEKIFSPTDYEKTDTTNFNLIYKDGITFILKNLLGIPKMVNQALEILGFKSRQDRIMDLTLEQLYDLLMLLNVSYANIMDFTCRSCSIGLIPQSLTDTIYNMEQQFSIKSTAFGRRLKRNKSKRLKKNTQSIYHKTKYTKKLK
uniref:Uncharacterized protein n=1 Tax=viral metagenome TaxID=1070528 RepID=A0A6C0IF91_9ZZZZ